MTYGAPQDTEYGNSDSSSSYIASIEAFALCSNLDSGVFYYDVPNLIPGDELAMLVMRSDSRCCDKLVHGLVAFVSSLGFEMLVGRIRSEFGKVTLRKNAFRYDDESVSSFLRKFQLFTAYFKRPASKSPSITHKPFGTVRAAIEQRLLQIMTARSMDWNSSLCSEDLAGIKEFKLLDDTLSYRLCIPSDWPVTESELRLNHRLFSQPVQGFGHRPSGQTGNARRYRLVIVGVNQAGFFTFVHTLLLLAGFRVVQAEIETVRGSYASNTYIVETYAIGGERVLRANFQCVVPLRKGGKKIDCSHPLIRLSDDSTCDSIGPLVGIWYPDGFSSYFGETKFGLVRSGFGRFWRSKDAQSLASHSYEGEWVDGCETGYGCQLSDDEGVVAYRFGRFENGQLIDGSILRPFEPPVRSVRVSVFSLPDAGQCVYRSLIQRADHWRRQLPKRERSPGYLPRKYVSCATFERYGWTLFAESPVPTTASMNVCQVAALLEMCGLAGKSAFAQRIDGGLLEAMGVEDLQSVLNLSFAQANMFATFASIISKAHNIDRHMRQPASVLDPLANPSVSGRVFPLDRMRVVDQLGEGAFGKVVYAEYQISTLVKSESTNCLSRSSSVRVLQKSKSAATMSNVVSSSVDDSLASVSQMFSANKHRANMYVALKEQVGSGALLENSCELVREWATLNALPHENIVKLEGICADASAPLFNKRYLATALLEASLPSLIYAQDAFGPAPKLTPLLTIQLAGDIASGLAHMHSLHVMHGDIKSPNVLVDIRTRDRATARICDFGHAAIRIGPRPQRRMCTFGWAAPESLRDAETDVSSDVWSWAVVVWEMYVKELPWRGCSHPQMLTAVGYCGKDPSGFAGMAIPERVLTEIKLAKLLAKCWNTDPGHRPSMNRVLLVVDKLGRLAASRAVTEMQALLENT